jgi:hypothetical protein
MAQEIDQNIFVRFDRLRDSLKQIIFDQDKAIDEVVDAFIHMAYKPVDTPPKAIFTFLGGQEESCPCSDLPSGGICGFQTV